MSTVVDFNVNPNNEPALVGEEQATSEQQKTLDDIMDTVEQAVHGQFRDKIANTMDSHPDLWKSTAQITNMLMTRVSHKLDEEQIPYDSSAFFGQNGAVQQTVQMLWEMADAMGHPAAEDDDQFQASYMASLELIGENMVDDDESAKEAQAFLLQQELGEDVVGAAASEMERESEAFIQSEGTDAEQKAINNGQ